MTSESIATLGISNRHPNSIANITVRQPCYCGHRLTEGDADHETRWGGVITHRPGSWVHQLQTDLIALGIQKLGLVFGKEIPTPPKSIKDRKTGALRRIPQPSRREWHKVTLTANGRFDGATAAALKLFQWHAKKVPVRQIGEQQSSVDITYTGDVDGVMSDAVCEELKLWKSKGYQIIKPTLSSARLEIASDTFRTHYESNPRPAALPFGPLSEQHFANLKQVLAMIADDDAVRDIRWAAYMLATTIHECRNAANRWKCTWAPIPETSDSDGRYAGGRYGSLEYVVDARQRKLDADGNVTMDATKFITRQYFGRGFVQLTHQDNYRRFGDLLGLDAQLQVSPDRVLEPEISYKIMSIGMRTGQFRRPHKLADYLNDDKTDYVGARAIINGDTSRTEPSAPTLDGKKMTNGQLVAHYADIFEWILYNSITLRP